MVAVSDISISLSTEDGNSKAILDFSPISSISEGDSIYLAIKDSNVELTMESDTSLSAWLDWVVSNYNLIPNISAILSRDSSNMVVLGNNSDDLDISLDLGSS